MFGDVAFAQTPFAALGGATFASSLSEAASGLDTVTVFNVIRGGNLSETASGISSVISSGNIMLAAQDSAASGVAIPNFAPSTFVALSSEAASGVATQTVIGTMLATQAETAVALDAPISFIQVLASIIESASAASTVGGSRLYAVTVSEAASGAATQTKYVNATASVAELATALGSVSSLKTLNVYPTGLQLTVSVGNALVWGTIVDAQDPNWQTISNVQTPGWTQIPS